MRSCSCPALAGGGPRGQAALRFTRSRRSPSAQCPRGSTSGPRRSPAGAPPVRRPDRLGAGVPASRSRQSSIRFVLGPSRDLDLAPLRATQALSARVFAAVRGLLPPFLALSPHGLWESVTPGNRRTDPVARRRGAACSWSRWLGITMQSARVPEPGRRRRMRSPRPDARHTAVVANSGSSSRAGQEAERLRRLHPRPSALSAFGRCFAPVPDLAVPIVPSSAAAAAGRDPCARARPHQLWFVPLLGPALHFGAAASCRWPRDLAMLGLLAPDRSYRRDPQRSIAVARPSASQSTTTPSGRRPRDEAIGIPVHPPDRELGLDADHPNRGPGHPASVIAAVPPGWTGRRSSALVWVDHGRDAAVRVTRDAIFSLVASAWKSTATAGSRRLPRPARRRPPNDRDVEEEPAEQIDDCDQRPVQRRRDLKRASRGPEATFAGLIRFEVAR